MKITIVSLLVTASAYFLGASVCSAQTQVPGPSGQIFLDDFNGYAVQTGSPPYSGYQVNTTTIGVTDVPANVVAGQAAFFGVDFSGGSTKFGGGFYDGLETNTVNLTGAMLMASVKSSAGPGPEGYFAFRIVDGAGDAYRSALLNPTAGFTTLSASVSGFVDNSGTGKINLTDIEEIDLIAYNLGDNVKTTLYIDNFQAALPAAVPEPSTVATCLLCLGVGSLLVRQHRRAMLRA